MHSRWASVTAGAILSVSLFVFPVVAQDRGAPRGEKYALLIGVRRYDPNQLRSLLYSEPDVVDLAAVLKDQGYKPDNVVLMTQTAGAEDPRYAPEAAKIRKELALLLGNLSAEDSVIVALAGHGVQFRGESESYFCPSDANLEDRRSLVSLGEVYTDLEGCKAGLKLLLVDACRNDPQADNSRARSAVDLASSTRPQQVQPPGGVVAMFSCSAGEKAYEHADLKHGVFFNFVIESFRSGASNSADGELTVPDLERSVKRQVADFVRAKYGVRQMPDRLGQERGLVPLVKLSASNLAFARGNLAFARHDFKGAIDNYTEAIRLDPESFKSYNNRGTAHARNGNPELALKDYTEAIRLDTTSALRYFNRGFIHNIQKHYDLAMADYTEAIRLDPRCVKAYYGRGCLYRDRNHYDLALADLNEAIRLDPRFVQAYECRGCLHCDWKVFDLALADLNEAIRLDPGCAKAFYGRGCLRREQMAYELALADLNEAIRLDPKFAHAYHNRGYVRSEQKAYDLAIADYTEAIRLDPNYARAYQNRSFAYENTGQAAKAQADRQISDRLTAALGGAK